MDSYMKRLAQGPTGCARIHHKGDTSMTHDPAELRRKTDEELLEIYREMKTEATGKDPALTPPAEGSQSAVREEMERRGLTPDREDIVPDMESPTEEPIVEDRA